MPRTSLDPQTTVDNRRRYLAAVQLARSWMARVGVNQAGLAQRIGENASYLSRFLDPQSGHEPTPRRPAMMRVLEKVEGYCSTQDFIHEVSPEELADDNEDEEAIWARNHMLRLRTLRDRVTAGQALVLVGEQTGQALHGPPGYESAMCGNTLLTIAAILDRLSPGGASRELILRTLARVDRLEETANTHMGVRTDALAAKVLGYASLARGNGGLLLAEDPLVERGIEGVLEAARQPHEIIDGLWNNALSFLDQLLGLGFGSATTWSAHAADLAGRDGGECVRNALTVFVLEHLKGHWREIAPELLASLAGEGAHS